MTERRRQPAKNGKILLSACLAGERVRYDGRQFPVLDPVIATWIRNRHVVPVCPERLGGLPVPRPPAEMEAGSAADVFAGKGRIRTVKGVDVTDAFLHGAARTLTIALEQGVLMAVFREKSPSCGRHRVYDGSFSGNPISGWGVATHLLLERGIPVYSDHEIHRAGKYLEEWETAGQCGSGCFSHPH